MNREIKFRCWDRVRKIMLPPDDMGSQIQMPNGDYFDGDVYYLEYTGWKDRNGKEIYEGDIVESNTTSFGHFSYAEVIFANGGFHFLLPNSKRVKEVDTSCYEVIGNIYENASLLEPNHTVL